jgi:hypothetical protein
MEIAVEILKVVCLFLALLFSHANIVHLITKNDIHSGNMIWWAIGMTGFIYLQFLQ